MKFSVFYIRLDFIVNMGFILFVISAHIMKTTGGVKGVFYAQYQNRVMGLYIFLNFQLCIGLVVLRQLNFHQILDLRYKKYYFL